MTGEAQAWLVVWLAVVAFAAVIGSAVIVTVVWP